jgi:hypothetical protein
VFRRFVRRFSKFCFLLAYSFNGSDLPIGLLKDSAGHTKGANQLSQISPMSGAF